MKLKRILSAVLTVVMTLSVGTADTAFADSVAKGEFADIIDNMTTEQKIAQMCMITCRRWKETSDSTAEDVTTVSDSFGELLSSYGFGGVTLFGENVKSSEQTVRFVDELQTANAKGSNPAQLLIGIDQEGGTVARIQHGTITPGNMALGAANSEEDAAAVGTIIGEEVKAIGANFNFAPVLDVNNNPNNPVINIRSISDDPETVARLGKAYLTGMRNTGIASSLKHFPGHGNTQTDSHTGFPVINSTYDELKKTELVPFAACINAGTDAIMTAHIQYPNVETEKYTSVTGKEVYLPATLSKTIITDKLRGDLGFKGVVITDALEMDAIEKYFQPMESAGLAINAGVDLLLMPVTIDSPTGVENMKQYIKDVAALVDSGKISEQNVDAALERIFTMKKNLGLMQKYDGSDLDTRISEANKTVGSDAHHAKEWEVTRHALTLVKNEDNTLPFINTANKRTVVFGSKDSGEPSLRYAVNKLIADGKLDSSTKVDYYSYGSISAEEAATAASGADYAVIISELTSAANIDPSSSSGADSVKIDKIIEAVHSGGGKTVLLSSRLPYDAARYQQADAIMLCWCNRVIYEDPTNPNKYTVFAPNVPVALYTMFDTEAELKGALPVDIPALNDNYGYSDTTLYKRGTSLDYTLTHPYGDADADYELTVRDAACALARVLDYTFVMPIEKNYDTPLTLIDVSADERLTTNDVNNIQQKIFDSNYIMPCENTATAEE